MKNSMHAALLMVVLTPAGTAKTIPNHAIANRVLGQNNFVPANSTDIISPLTQHPPAAVVIDPVTRKLFVSDSNTNRVLRYSNAAALTNGASPEMVFGQ